MIENRMEGTTMVSAVILINAKRTMIKTLAKQLVEMEAISEVYSVAGPYDLVAIARVSRNEDLSDLVTDEMTQMEGIEDTTTLFAFKTYSQHDLERMFAIGLNA